MALSGDPERADRQDPARPLERREEVAHRLEQQEREDGPHVTAQENARVARQLGLLAEARGSSGSAFHRISQNRRLSIADSHSAWRNERRTSRTLVERRPSAVAIIGAAAVIIPMPSRTKAKVRLSPSAEAASWRGPSQPISTTSVAWISCMVRLARISGQASAIVARISARQGAEEAVVAIGGG